ncbi:MAG: flagellar hook-length control protein FliK [Candidatus Anammoxibacter sp.]
MQDTNVLLTQSKTTLLNEVTKAKSQVNIQKNVGVQQGQAFVDLLFSNHVDANNAVGIKFNDQARYDRTSQTETRKAETGSKLGKSDSFSKQNNSTVNDRSAEYGDYNQDGYRDIYDDDSDRFVSQNRASDMSVAEDDKTNIETDENSVATADHYNESKVETIQENSDLSSYKDISHKESVTDSKDEKNDIEEIDEKDVKSDTITKLESLFAGLEGKDVKEVKAEIISRLKVVLSGMEETEGKSDKTGIITKLEGLFAGLEGKEIKDVKAEIISKLKEVLSGMEETEGKSDKSGIITKLEGLFAGLEGKDVKDVKAEIISRLKEVLSGMEETQGKGDKSGIITKLEGLFAGLEGKDVKDVKADIISRLKVVLSGMEETEGKGDKSGIITKLEGLFAGLEGKDVKDVKAEIISRFKEVLSGMEETEGKSDKSGIITKLEGLFAGLEGKDVKEVKAEIISRLKEVITGIEEKEGKLVKADIVDESNNHGKNKKIVKSSEGEIDKNLLKAIVEKLEENKSEKIINKDKNIEKKHIVNDTASNDLNGAKVSGKTKESADGSSKSTGDSSFTLENETGAEVRVAKDGNRIDTSNSGRDIRVTQSVVGAQGAKSGLADQRQNKDRLASQMKDVNNVKSDKGNLQRTDADQQVVSGKTQTTFRSAAASQVNNTPASSRTIPQSQLGETIVRNAKQFQKGGNSEVHLTIKRPELGKVKLSFVENGKGKLEVTLVAERHETADIIRQNSSEMRQMLQQDGIDVSKFDVFDQGDRNKKDFAQGGLFNNGSRKNRSDSAEDEGLDETGETVVVNNDLSVSDADNVNSDDKVNVFV